MSDPRPRKLRLGRELLVGLVATVGMLLALEIGARLYVWAGALVTADEFEAVHPDGKAGIEINSFGFRSPEISLVKPARTLSEWVETVREHVRLAVDARMMRDVPVGVFLSGGIDSSTTLGLMARGIRL
jgi:asparagine synthase